MQHRIGINGGKTSGNFSAHIKGGKFADQLSLSQERLYSQLQAHLSRIRATGVPCALIVSVAWIWYKETCLCWPLVDSLKPNHHTENCVKCPISVI